MLTVLLYLMPLMGVSNFNRDLCIKIFLDTMLKISLKCPLSFSPNYYGSSTTFCDIGTTMYVISGYVAQDPL